MKSSGIKEWMLVAAFVGAAGTAMAVIPAQVTLLPNPPSVPCTTGACAYAPEQYSSAAYYVSKSGTGFGSTLAMADFNRDGLEDLVIGAPLAENGHGGIWLVYGVEKTSAGTVQVDTSEASWIPGEAIYGRLGVALAAGDVTGDGYADLVVGAPSAGLVYVLPSTTTTVDLAGTDITYWPGAYTISLVDTSLAAREAFGSSLAIGDISSNSSTVLQDGKNELLVGAPGGSRAYMLYGPIKEGAVAGEKAYGFFMYGQSSDMVGGTVAMLRDMDGDGALDFAVGGSGGGNVAGGKVYTIAGRSKSSIESVVGSAGLDLNSTVTMTRRRTFVGDLVYKSAITGRLGSALAGGVDLNGDLRADLLMSAPIAPSYDGSVADVGRVYFVAGSSSFFGTGTAAPIATGLNSSGLPYFVGNSGGASFGASLAMAGDLDGDALGDFLLGTQAWTSAGKLVSSGSTFLLSGRTSKWSLGMQPDGPRFDGQYSGIWAGGTLLASPLLDLDGDGHNDFFISILGDYPTSTTIEYRVLLISSGDYWDRDSDGQMRAAGDCDDGNRSVYYRTSGEVCDGYDNDCDGLLDAQDPGLENGTIRYVDEDGDGFGDDSQPSIVSCGDIIITGTSELGGDCDDTNKYIYPNASERCNGIDDDCDGAVDMDDTSIYTTSDSGLVWFYQDLDQDGYGSSVGAILACDQPEGHVDNGDDCNDALENVYPGAPEGVASPSGCLVSDGVDNSCNEVVDEGTCGVDDDRDGYSEDQGDCLDSDASIFVGAPERCDQLDNDCDTQVDEDFDADLDGHYDAQLCKGQYAAPDCDDTNPNIYSGAAALCDGADTDCDGEIPDTGMLSETDEDGDDYRPCDGDCRDDDAQIHPDALEVCDGIDNNCDEVFDDAEDTDQDGSSLCEDCNDLDPSSYPGAPEKCDGIDNDCDGNVPDSGADSELDGDGDEVLACDGDCNDADDEEYPGAPEKCDGEDNDCDGRTDEDPADGDTFYLDDDGDGEGDKDETLKACSAPRNYVSNDSDCNDSNGDINSQAVEVCDGVDTDCNGESDDAEPIFDRDEDGYLDAEACAALDGEMPLDCEDLKAEVHPDAEEIPGDGVDSDCDGEDPSNQSPTPLPSDLVADSLGCSCTVLEAEGAASGRFGSAFLLLGLVWGVSGRRRRGLSSAPPLGQAARQSEGSGCAGIVP